MIVSVTIHSAGYEFCRAAALHRPASVEKFCTIHAAKFPLNKKKSWRLTCPWRLLLVSSTDVLMYVMLSPTNTAAKSPFFPVRYARRRRKCASFSVTILVSLSAKMELTHDGELFVKLWVYDQAWIIYMLQEAYREPTLESSDLTLTKCAYTGHLSR